MKQLDFILETMPIGAGSTRSKVDGLALRNNSVLVFPSDVPNLYPSKGTTQLTLGWYVNTVPTNATTISLTPIGSMAVHFFSSGGDPVFGNSTSTGLAFQHTFNELSVAQSRVNPYPFAITKTAADSTVTFTDQTGTNSGALTQIGTRHPIPLNEPITGFWLQHDGTDATGFHTVWVSVSWSDEG